MKIILSAMFACVFFALHAQTSNVINTSVPFLRISPDARSSAIGDAGIATSADIHSIFWNTAKLGFSEDDFGAAINYTPWLQEVSTTIFLADVSAFWKFDSLNVVTVSFRDFNLGELTFQDSAGNTIGNLHPNEYTVHAGYARKLSRYFSAGINLGYVHSNLAEGYSVNGVQIQPASTLMADLSVFYSHLVRSSWFKNYNLGVSVSNLGGKMSYTGDPSNGDFLPANLGIGSNFNFRFGKDHQLSLALDLNKLLVPTPHSSGSYRSKSVLEGALESFSDAPGGFDEELAEVTFSTGAEYWFRNLIAWRTGFFYEAKTKGGREFFTLGAGVKYWKLQLDAAYLIPTSSQKNPFDNIFRLGLSCYLNSFKKSGSVKS